MSYILHADPQIVFIHIPKTAGRSILDMFKKNNFEYTVILNNRSIYNNYHSTLEDFSNFMCPLDTPFVFTVVRNPWDRVVSWFWFRKSLLRKELKKVKKNNYSTKAIVDYDLLKTEYNKMEDGFDVWLYQYYDREWDYTWFKLSTPQNYWLKSKKYKINKIIKFENLQKDFNKINYFDNYNLPHKNRGIIQDKKFYKNIYNVKSKNFVKQIYEEDIDLFKYSF